MAYVTELYHTYTKLNSRFHFRVVASALKLISDLSRSSQALSSDPCKTSSQMLLLCRHGLLLCGYPSRSMETLGSC